MRRMRWGHRPVSALVELRGVDVSVGGHAALRGVDLTIRRGEIVTVVGPNGSGKTTLMRTILGALTPTGGRIARAPGLRVGYVPQALRIDATLPMTAARFLSLPRRRPAAEVGAALARAGAGALAGRQMTALSGGQARRVLLARAMMDAPDLLMLDEPTTGLDQPGSAAFYREIERVRGEAGCAVLMVSHELHVVMAASDRVICLNGHVCCEGTPGSVAGAPEYRALFGTGTDGALALYAHDHDHRHDEGHDRKPDRERGHA